MALARLVVVVVVMMVAERAAATVAEGAEATGRASTTPASLHLLRSRCSLISGQWSVVSGQWSVGVMLM